MPRTCWARELGDCKGPLTGEHPVSGAFFSSRLVRLHGSGVRDGLFGMPSFKRKMLCAHHNSALSPVDTEAKIFSDSLKDAEHRVQSLIYLPNLNYRINGPRLERWFLKTFINLFICKPSGWHYPGGFPPTRPPIHLVRAAFGLETLKPPMGLHDLGPHRDKRAVENYFSYGLLSDDSGTACGALFEAHLLIYVLWIRETPPPTRAADPCLYRYAKDGARLIYHNQLGQWRGDRMTCLFHFDWGNEPRP